MLLVLVCVCTLTLLSLLAKAWGNKLTNILSGDAKGEQRPTRPAVTSCFLVWSEERGGCLLACWSDESSIEGALAVAHPATSKSSAVAGHLRRLRQLKSRRTGVPTRVGAGNKELLCQDVGSPTKASGKQVLSPTREVRIPPSQLFARGWTDFVGLARRWGGTITHLTNAPSRPIIVCLAYIDGKVAKLALGEAAAADERLAAVAIVPVDCTDLDGVDSLPLRSFLKAGGTVGTTRAFDSWKMRQLAERENINAQEECGRAAAGQPPVPRQTIEERMAALSRATGGGSYLAPGGDRLV